MAKEYTLHPKSFIFYLEFYVPVAGQQQQSTTLPMPPIGEEVS